MFQTDLNHFLQSFASDGLTAFMRFITALGYPTFLMLFLLILLFAVNFKKAYLLFMILLWTTLVTLFFKSYFNLPRPFHVDNTLQFLDGQLPDEATFQFSKRDATSFWASLPADVLAVTRQSKGLQNGFPSGHTSDAIALWAALALLFRKRWISMLAISLIILIPISRIYLGVHFLADVLGGLVLGAIMLGLFYTLLIKPDKLSYYLQKNDYELGINKISFLFLFLPIIGFLFIPEKYYLLVAFLLGFGLSFLLLARNGLPLDDAPLPHKIGRTIIGIVIFVIFNFGLKTIADQLGLGENVAIEFIRNFLGSIALMWLGIMLSTRLGWFKRDLNQKDSRLVGK